VVLATAGVIVPFAKSFKINSVVAFMACGALLGPFGLGGLVSSVPLLSTITVSSPEALAGPAELGVAFLLFVIGLELSFERLKTMRRLVFGLGLGQIVLSAAAIGGVAYALGQPTTAALIIGFGLALSSTAMVVELLSAKKRMTSSAGRASFAVLISQDIAVVPAAARCWRASPRRCSRPSPPSPRSCSSAGGRCGRCFAWSPRPIPLRASWRRRC